MNLPIKYAKYLLNGIKTNFAPITVEKAVYDASGGGRTLDQKIAAYDSNFGDAFSTTKSYALGDYCIYLNRLYRFIAAKSAGAWDSSKVEESKLTGLKKIIYVSGNIPSVFQEYVNIASYTIPTNDFYLILTRVGINISVGLNNDSDAHVANTIEITNKPSSGEFNYGGGSQGIGNSGGGVVNFATVCNCKNADIILRSYGYMNRDYNIGGRMTIIRL